jgi:hypothetical protein
MAPGFVARAAWGGTSPSGASPNRQAGHHEGRERHLLGLAMAGQTNATDTLNRIASIAFGSCTG